MQELTVRPRSLERTLERPNRPLGFGCGSTLPNRLEQSFGVDGIPVQQSIGSIERSIGSRGCLEEGARVGNEFPLTLSKEVEMHSDVWTYRDATELGSNIASVDISGFKIEALDGSIGKVDDATFEAAARLIVVDTGPWIFGKKVMLPAGVDRRRSTRRREGLRRPHEGRDQERAGVRRPMLDDDAYRSQLGTYYGPGGPAHRDWDDTV